MITKVKVFNDNVYPLIEIFKGDEVNIGPKDYWRDKNGEPKILDIFEANDFRGTYHPVPFDGSGKMLDDARYFKKIKMEPVDVVEMTIHTTSASKCMAPNCKHVSASPEELATHAQLAHPNVDRLILPEQDQMIKSRATKNKPTGD